jgi:hypothetical protein
MTGYSSYKSLGSIKSLSAHLVYDPACVEIFLGWFKQITIGLLNFDEVFKIRLGNNYNHLNYGKQSNYPKSASAPAQMQTQL